MRLLVLVLGLSCFCVLASAAWNVRAEATPTSQNGRQDLLGQHYVDASGSDAVSLIQAGPTPAPTASAQCTEKIDPQSPECDTLYATPTCDASMTLLRGCLELGLAACCLATLAWKRKIEQEGGCVRDKLEWRFDVVKQAMGGLCSHGLHFGLSSVLQQQSATPGNTTTQCSWYLIEHTLDTVRARPLSLASWS